jgi:PAS domain S-box-containing protein
LHTLCWSTTLVLLPVALLDGVLALRLLRYDGIVISCLAYLLLIAASMPALPYTVRAHSLLSSLLVVTIWNLAHLGALEVGAALIVLLMVVAALLLPWRSALAYSLGAGVALLVLFGGMALRWLPTPLATAEGALGTTRYLLSALIVVGVGAMATWAVLSLVRRFTRSLSELDQTVAARTAELHRQQQIWQHLLDNSPVLISVKDLEGRYLLANRAFASALGLVPPALHQRRDSDVFPPDALEQIRRYDDVVRQTSQPMTGELSLEQGQRTFLMNKFPLFNKHGDVTAICCIATDISARKQAEEVSRAREHFIQRVTDASPDIIYVYDHQQQRSVYANREVATVLGYSTDEIRQLGTDLLATLFVPEDFARVPEMRQQLMNAADGEVVEFIYRARHKDGNLRWLFSREVVFARDADGCPTQTLGFAQDITARKAAEEELRYQKQLLDTFLDKAPVGMGLVDRDLRFVWVNQALADLDEQPLEAYAGCSVYDVLPHVAPFAAPLYRQVLTTGQPIIEHEMSGISLRGKKTWHALVNYHPLACPDGNVMFVGAIITSITARKEAELAVQQSNTALQRHVKELATLNEIAQALTSWTQLHRALHTVAALLGPLFPVATITIWEFVADEGFQRIVEVDGQAPQHYWAALDDTPLGRQLARQRRTTIRAVVAPDALLTERAANGEVERAIMLAQPILARGHLLGCLCMQATAERPFFAPADIERAQTIASLLANSIENARLLAQITSAAAEEERRRLARELHDSVTQSLYSLALQSHAWATLAARGQLDDVPLWCKQVEVTAVQALRELRLLIHQLRQPELERQGLVGALQQRLDAVEGRAQIATRLVVSSELLPLDYTVERELFAIAIEALNNSLRHAQATNVQVAVTADVESVTLSVSDDGRGFDPLRASAGVGLHSMRERSEQLGGVLELTTTPGSGTTVSARVPLVPRPHYERLMPAEVVYLDEEVAK